MKKSKGMSRMFDVVNPLAPKPKLMTGTLSVTRAGYGFVNVESEDDDIFVPQEKLNGALHTDVVEISVIKGRGEVKRVVKRTLGNIVGTLMKSRHGAFIIPDDDRLGDGFNVVGTVTNDMLEKKVVAHLVGESTVKISEVLGDPETVGVDITSIIREFNLNEKFPSHVEAEAKRVAVTPTDKEIKRRLDLRNKFIITIDPADAKDLDDAISLELLPDGNWELGVHIADVSHYVTEGSELDKEAYNRATSVYFPDRVIPMLPHTLSSDVCSLLPNIDRLTLSIIMNIDTTGKVVKSQLHESIININHRFSYDQVQDFLDKKTKPNRKTGEVLEHATTLTHLFEDLRKKRGEVIFDVPEPKIVLSPETGKIVDVVAYPHKLSHRIIESFMVAANETVAKKMFDMNMPFVYRTHEKPDPLKVQQLIDTLAPFKVEHRLTSAGATGFDYQHMLGGLNDELKPIIGGLALRSMQKAKYREINVGHFGLGAKFYCHFTSPIRRYPDLVIHRIIKMMLSKELNEFKLRELKQFCKGASEQSTRMEIMATEAEREVDALKRAQYMSDKIGETFTGTIAGIRDFGVFVYLQNTVEGLIRIENMPDDTYRFDAKQMILVGKRRTYKMGDKIDVTVASVNVARRQIEFNAVN